MSWQKKIIWLSLALNFFENLRRNEKNEEKI